MQKLAGLHLGSVFNAYFRNRFRAPSPALPALEHASDRARFSREAIAQLSSERNEPNSSSDSGELDVAQVLKSIRKAFLSSTGSRRFNEAADLDGNGVINFGDLAALREKLAANVHPTRPAEPDPVTRPAEPAPEPVNDLDELLAGIRARFYSTVGDDRYAGDFDLTGDGVINFADLAALRAKITANAPPTRPAEPGVPPVPPAQPEPPPDPTNDVQALLAGIQDRFFSSVGDDRYAADFDLTDDGVINFADLAALRAKVSANEPPAGQTHPTRPAEPAHPPTRPAEPAPRPVTDREELLAGIKARFFTSVGDDRYSGDFDLDGNGVINFGDLAALRAKIAAADHPTRPLEPAPRPPGIEELKAAFFSTEGSDNFDSRLDLNQDGVINFGDLAALRASESDEG